MDDIQSPISSNQDASSVNSGAASREDVAQLRELTSTLLQAVGSLQARTGRTQTIDSLVDDVRAATRTMALAGGRTAANGVPEAAEKDDCGCGPCGCVSSACCTFQVEVTHARVTEMQIIGEIFDSNANPNAQMEIQFFASIDGVGTVVPNLFSTISLRKNIGKAGMWYPVKRTITTVAVCKGATKSVTVNFEVKEVDEGTIGEAAMGRDEYGTGKIDMPLNCCLTVPTTASIEIDLDNNGLGRGAVEFMLSATKVCC